MITSAAFSPNEEFVLAVTTAVPKTPASNESASSTMLWEAQKGRKLKVPKNHSLRDANSSCFSPDSSALVLPGPGNDATVYRTDGITLQFVLKGGDSPISLASFSPNGKHIATVDQAGTISLWNAADGKLEKAIAAEDNFKAATQIAFSSDSNYVLLSSKKGTCSYALWSEAKPAPTFWRESHFVLAPSGNRCACFSPWDRRVTIRNIETGEAICELEKLPQPISSLETTQIAFTDNGQRLVVALDATCALSTA